MKKLIFSVSLMLSMVVFASHAFAVTDVNETAGDVYNGAISITTNTYVDISSVTAVGSPFAYNICSEAASGGSNVRCGYTVSVSTIAGNVNQGFWVKPQECEYRAVSAAIYCKAEGAAAITITREIFGKPF